MLRAISLGSPVAIAIGIAISSGCGGTLQTGAGPAADEPRDAAVPRDLARAVGPGPMPGMDMNCGGQAFGVTRIPPNALLVLDRSGSMTRPISVANPNGPVKWVALQDAIRGVVTQYDMLVQFGVDFFPAPLGGDCSAGPIGVGVGVQRGSQILGALNKTTPGGETPTAITLDVVLAQGQLNDKTRDNFVVIATDGVPNCGDTDVVARIQRLYAQTPPVKTYIIGVGDGPGAADPVALTAWAQAGRTARPGPVAYYTATSPKDLADAFGTIIGGVVSCSFALAKTPPDPAQLYVWMNGKMVAVDATNGWSYNAMGPVIVLHGAACQQLKTVAGTRVQVVYGCPAPPPVM